VITAAVAVCAAAAILFAVLALFQRSLYGSALCLLVVLLQVAALYFLLGARLLGLLQVLIYAGAVMVLIVIAVMASAPRVEKLWADGPPRSLAWVALAVPLLELLVLAPLARDAAPALPPAAALERGTALLLFGPYAPLTEALGLLVLVAALAVVRERPDEGAGR
jgi:NADH-quinone oxidoreductase subunit J